MTAPATSIYKRQEMITVKHIAERWNLSKSYIYLLVESGKLSAFKFGGVIRVHITKVIEYEKNAEFDAGDCSCWVVGRRVLSADTWQLQGIAVNKSDAVQMCRDATYFIGPVPFNSALPHEQAEWAGCYYPLASV